jgi:hypothetical protein
MNRHPEWPAWFPDGPAIAWSELTGDDIFAFPDPPYTPPVGFALVEIDLQGDNMWQCLVSAEHVERLSVIASKLAPRKIGALHLKAGDLSVNWYRTPDPATMTELVDAWEASGGQGDRTHHYIKGRIAIVPGGQRPWFPFKHFDKHAMPFEFACGHRPTKAKLCEHWERRKEALQRLEPLEKGRPGTD